MRGKKILATMVAIVMIAATFVVVRELTDFSIVEKASADMDAVPGFTYWDGNNSNSAMTCHILNMSTATIKYGNTPDNNPCC